MAWYGMVWYGMAYMIDRNTKKKKKTKTNFGMR